MTACLRSADLWRGPSGALVLLALIWLALAGWLGGCTMTETEQRSFSGAGIGAAAGAAGGALFGAFAGVPGAGAAIGAAAGAAIGGAGGYVYDQYKQREQAQAENTAPAGERAAAQGAGAAAGPEHDRELRPHPPTSGPSSQISQNARAR
jgi:uncharacterized membrane protein YebE (DUF533 family)